MEGNNDEIIKKIEKIEENNDEIIKKIEDLHKSTTAGIDTIKLIIAENELKQTLLDYSEKKLCTEINNLKSELNKTFASVVGSEVKKSVDSINLEVKNVSKTINTVIESKERETNMIVFRLKEGDADKTSIEKIVKHMTKGTCDQKNIVKIYRLGKKSDIITRPILIKFDDGKNKELVLRNSHRLKSIGDDLTGIGLSHDLTSEQRTELKQLVSSAKKQESEDKEGKCYVYLQENNKFGPGNKKYNTNKKMVRIGLLNVRSINNKVVDVYGMIYDGLDILVLCETWHGTEGNISVRLAMPPGFTFVDFVRPHDPGYGGLVIYFRSDLKYKKINLPLFSKFEALAIRLKIGIDQFCLIALYRPGSEQTTSLFFEELISMLEFIKMSEAHVVLMGDFNIYVKKRDSPFTLRLHEILDMFQLVNHVNQQTHVSGGTLDLVICSQDFPILNTKIDPCSVYSDHSYVGVRVALNQVRPK
ncbi:hypothetical protein HELRODRAFT_162707 [Helobdella robusta]|uniref:Endonuclease/exonuclease/phosphatase domain-containing protein n=1 Tax=Helobdella robusta TaxID=6412 RepID=T1ET14_HELRO|nr:hypothetical protein HELRODRAFT_162707 [Helobdella robusta]ESN99199.1 hypothetical protein HELRODRAFT_162707 [Helobdella robusta]